MDTFPWLVGSTVVAVTVVAWLAASALGRVNRTDTLRGLRNGSIVAVVAFLVTTVVVALIFSLRPPTFVSFNGPVAIVLGALAGVLVALGYMLVGSLLMAIGFIFHAKSGWTTAGAWAAVPVIVVSLGFGYVSFRSVQQEGAPPASSLGSVALQLTGQQLGAVDVNGHAQCEYDGTGSLRLRAGGGVAGTTIATPDGRQVYVKFSLDGSAIAPSIQAIVGSAEVDPGKGWTPGPDTITLSPGSTTSAGSAALTNLVPVNAKGVPDTTERWSGKVSWSCTPAP